MKIKVNTPLKDTQGKDLKEVHEALTFRLVVINSLLAPTQGDTDKVKWEKYEIYKKIRDANGEVDLSLDELKLIKDSSGKVHPQLIMGQVWEIIEGKN